jgi:hypothetical protein
MDGRIAGRLLSPFTGRGTVRGLGYFPRRSFEAAFVSVRQQGARTCT